MPRVARLALLLITLPVVGCESEGPRSVEPSPAVTLIRQAQAAHGTSALDGTEVAFDFRGRRFTARLDGGAFEYARTYVDSSGADVREVLTADTLYRTVGGEPAPLDSAEHRRVETVVNSVVYFALLPRALTDPAVQPRYLGATTIDGEPYEEVEVTFAEEGGGRDHEDRFVYWIHRDRHTVDYLAYYFYTGEGGARFRRAVNPRTVGGWRVQDYVNYTADGIGPDEIDRFEDVLAEGRLERISEVVLDEVRVEALGTAEASNP